MKPEMGEKIKFGVWGIIGGAVVAIVIGFSLGGWSTAGATQKAAESAVITSQTAICVAQYMRDGDSTEKLKALETIDSYKRSEFIEKGGWDKMPGQKEASFGVSSACADVLATLVKK